MDNGSILPIVGWPEVFSSSHNSNSQGLKQNVFRFS